MPEATGILTPESLEALQTSLGDDLLADAAKYSDPLLAVTVLRRRYPIEMVGPAVEMADLRRRAAEKLDDAGRMYFMREALEQASDGRIAAWRAQRYSRYAVVADWGCGIGVDSLALSEVTRTIGLDMDPLRVAVARANALALRRHHVEFHVADYLALQPHTEAIWADPSRRPGGHRVTDPSEYEPPLQSVVEHADGRPLGVKVSPAIDAADIPLDAEAEFISVNGDLKECALWFGGLRTAGRRATVLPEGETLVPCGEIVQTAPPGSVLYDPDPAVLRAGAVKDLGRMLSAWQIDPAVAYLTANYPVSTPFAQTLSVLATMPWNLKDVKRHLRGANLRVEEIRKRASPVDVDAVRKALRTDGAIPVILVLTRVEDKPAAIIATRWKG